MMRWENKRVKDEVKELHEKVEMYEEEKKEYLRQIK